MKSVEINNCPACGSKNVQKHFIVSKSGFMSIPGFNHSLCNHCKTVFLNPRPNENELKEFYLSEKTESDVNSDIVMNSIDRVVDPIKLDYFIKNRVNPVAEFLNKDSNIFDIGCGTGAFIKAMQNSGFDKIKGCDLSEVSVKGGKKHLSLADEDIYIGGIYDLPDEKYDLITAWTVIEHLLNPGEFLDYVYSKLHEKGFLLLEFPTADSLMFEYFPEDFQWIMPPYHINLFSKSGINSLIQKHGFEIRKTHLMPKNWGFFEVLSKKANLDKSLKKAILDQSPEFVFNLDSFFDKLSLKENKTSAIQIICSKI